MKKLLTAAVLTASLAVGGVLAASPALAAASKKPPQGCTLALRYYREAKATTSDLLATVDRFSNSIVTDAQAATASPDTISGVTVFLTSLKQHREAFSSEAETTATELGRKYAAAEIAAARCEKGK